MLRQRFISKNPATDETIWEGFEALPEDIDSAIQNGKEAFTTWSNLEVEQRASYLKKFQAILQENKEPLARIISEETGKPLWEARNEVESMINKIPISVQAYQDRCKILKQESNGVLSLTRHKPYGVVGILGPFNFPGHLPNGHIIPALLAGNTIVFKSSEETPLVSEKIIECWQKASLPEGVINLIQGGPETGRYLAEHRALKGLFFTGSFQTGQIISKLYAERLDKILALEMGGNNPLVVHKIEDNISAAIYHIIQSAYITSGQRCSCARRLILTKNSIDPSFVDALIKTIQKIRVGHYKDIPEPFMGPVISMKASEKIMRAYEDLLKKGAKVLCPLKNIEENRPFLSPALIEVTSVQDIPDEEIFGPVLQLTWVEDFEEAIIEANKTEYGLTAGLLCNDEALYREFFQRVKAGIINWNRPLTGASSQAPFGGLGKSGNHRPSGYYAADYCAYPVASQEDHKPILPKELLPGLSL